MPQIPEQLLNSLSQMPGFNREAFIEAHHEENRITSVRMNPFKKVPLDFETGDRVKWHPDAYYLPTRPSFTHDPLFHAGCYYVQEAGSMFLDLALRQTLDLARPLKVLDACASPGGKSTLVDALLKEDDLLVSNEMIRSRAAILTGNLGRWGTCNTVVTNNETGRFSGLTSFFDAIVVDAPCSGSGLFRKQPEAVEHWSVEAVESCSMRQKQILTDLAPCLKAGGYLFYSTCSFSVEENENIVNWLIRKYEMEEVKLQIDADMGIVEDCGYRFYPHLAKSEGFYLAVLRKTGGEERFSASRGETLHKASDKESEQLKELVEPEGHLMVKMNERFHLLNEAAADFLSLAGKQFYFRKAGTVIGEIKGRDLVPAHELALSIRVKKTVASLELSREDALRYLKKENLGTMTTAKGLHLITYKNQGLGWAKLLPNRVNNYLPAEFRVLR